MRRTKEASSASLKCSMPTPTCCRCAMRKRRRLPKQRARAIARFRALGGGWDARRPPAFADAVVVVDVTSAPHPKDHFGNAHEKLAASLMSPLL
jgi:hypothetical protein